MAPKSRKKLKGRAKEVMLVTSRLMAISLVVDDYIYKNKPITLFEAIKFDEEITSLKIKCHHDTRSLQVVEKLKTFMKGIIKEQSTDRRQGNSIYVTETCDNNNALMANNINTLQTDTATEFFIDRKSPNSEINAITTATQNINTQNKILKNINPVINVRNTEITQVGSTDINTPNNSNLNGESEKSICTSKNINFDKEVFLTNPTHEKEQQNTDLVTLAPSNLQKAPEQEKTCLVQENQKSVQNTTEIKNRKEKQTIINKTSKKNKISAKNVKTKTKKYISIELENKSSGENKPKKKPKEKSQVNFSWVENLKYVREVSPDEHTDLQIDDNFWTNLTLPGICNSNDFD